jgi:heat-inducible transcriptional repressor
LKSLQIKDKEEKLLYLIIDYYLKIGKPISSGFLVEKSSLSMSSATVRNIMVRLEKNGFLHQPHTSAGRIPTDKGLRYYVNCLFEEVVWPQEKIPISAQDFGRTQSDFNSLLTQTSEQLSILSDNMGFVISPQISKINFKHLRFIKISEEKVLIIIVSSSNLVINEVVETKNYFTQPELDSASRYINENFSEKNLLFVRDYLHKEVPKYKMRFENVLQKLNIFLKNYFVKEEEENKIFMKGTSKFLEKPELLNMDSLISLFQQFEEKTKLAKLLSDFISLDRVKVLIGSELNLPDISDCSLVLSHYGDDRQVLGSLGIIGPKRIPYKQIIPMVDNIAKKLSQKISIKR